MSAMEDISQETVQRLRAQAEAENISLDALVNRMLTNTTDLSPPAPLSDMRYRDFFDHLPVLAFVHLPGGQIVYCNHAFAAHMGRAPSDVVGLNLFQLVPPPIADIIQQNLASLTPESSLHTDERQLDFPAGRLRWERWTDRAFFDDAGNVRYYLSVGQDVTEGRNAMETLRISEKRLSNLLDNLPGMAFRSANTPEWTAYFVSSGCQALTGYPSSALLGDAEVAYGDLIHPDDRQRVWEAVQEAIAAGEQYEVEYRFYHADGSLRHAWERGIAVQREDGSIQLEGFITDITESKRTLDRLRQSEALYESLVETLPMNIYRVDQDGVVTFANQRLLEGLGMEAEEVLGRTSYDIYPEELARKYRSDDAYVLQRGETLRFTEVNISPKDGEERYVEVLKTPVYDAEGNAEGVQGAFWDVTERLKLEQAVRESEARYRGLVEDLPVMICTWKPGGEITFVNQGYARAFGKSPDDLMGTSFLNLVPQEERETVQGMMDALTPEKPTQVTEHRVVAADGTVRWQRWTDRVVFTDGGAIQSYQSIGEDITERKEAEGALQKKHAELDRFFSITPSLLAMADFDARFIRLNDAWETVLGHSLEEMYARRFLDFVHPEDVQPTIDAMRQLQEEQPILSFVNRYRASDGDYRYVEWTAQSDGEFIYSAALDITERIQAEELAQQMTRLKSRVQKEREHNALIQRIISALSHDLRTPLTVVQSSKDLLAMHYERLSAQRRDDLLETIDRQIQFATHLLEDTVQMARGTLSEEAFNPAPTNLELLCRLSIDEVITVDDGQHRMIFTSNSSQELVMIDEVLVSRILLNLLSNAVKYSPDNSEIRLELHYDGERILMRVRDQGQGIPQDELPHIFVPFFRGDGVADINGTGLGLSIVKDCVERHQGKIYVDSTPGAGTTFTVELPLLAAAQSA